MIARAPSPIALQDLDRDELLQLLANRGIGAAYFSPLNILSARYDVAARHARKARDAMTPISEAYWSAARGVDPTTMSRRAWNALQKDREAKRLAYEAAQRRTRRAEAAEDRAWKAYMAASEQRVPA